MAVLHCSHPDPQKEEGIRRELSAERGMTPARFSEHNLLYVRLSILSFFLSLQQKKINCKDRQEFVFILPWWAAGARMEEDSCGGRLADPLPSASPMPCCTEPMTKQACRNTGQTLRASHWDAESTTAKKILGGKKKSFALPNTWLFFFFLN